MKKLIFILFIITPLFICNCTNEDKVAKEILKIPIQIKVSRFDKEFAAATIEDIPALKNNYSFLFPKQYPDSIWRVKLKDTIQIELNNEVAKAFPNLDKETEDLNLLFKHIKYYFPKFPVPEVITLTSDVGYENRVILTDSLLLIGLDNYLGKDHKFYKTFPTYIAVSLDKQFLISDVASEFCQKIMPNRLGRTFLEQMVYYGKQLYIKDKIMTFQSEAQRIAYTTEELEWAIANEVQIWRYFVEKELIYSTDRQLKPRLLDAAPFSKFQLELIDKESPGQIGRYIGWQIVRAFMKNNDVTLQQLLRMPAEEIFKKSNYKPIKSNG